MVILYLWVSHLGTVSRPGERDFGFSPYDSLESLIFCDKISCCLVRGLLHNRGFKQFFFNFWPQRSELRQNGWKCEQELSRVSWALAQISCLYIRWLFMDSVCIAYKSNHLCQLCLCGQLVWSYLHRSVQWVPVIVVALTGTQCDCALALYPTVNRCHPGGVKKMEISASLLALWLGKNVTVHLFARALILLFGWHRLSYSSSQQWVVWVMI